MKKRHAANFVLGFLLILFYYSSASAAPNDGSVIVDSSKLYLSGGGTAGSSQLQIFFDPALDIRPGTPELDTLGVGDTLLIEQKANPDPYTVSSSTSSTITITVDALANGLKVGDSLILNRGMVNQEIAVISNITGSTLTLKDNLKNSYSNGATIYRPRIEKRQIIAINFMTSPYTYTLDTPLRFTHSNGASVAISNTAASGYEHNSDYANNQSGGSEPTIIANPNKMPGTTNVTVPRTSGPHGKFTTNTNSCGRCHQLHVAKGPKLIRFDITSSMNATNPIYATCTFCHTYNGQSTYDVKNGQIWDTWDGKRYATNGGGFERMLVVEGDPSNATFVKVTSKHRVNEQWNSSTGEYVKFNAPGGFAETNGHVQLTCTACHNPHGTKNGRQLVEQVPTVDPHDPSNTSFTRNTSTNGPNRAVVINVQNPFEDEKIKYSKEIISFCGACHWDYTQSQGGDTPSGDYSYKYRHLMGMQPNTGWNSGSSTELNLGYNKNKLILPLGTEGETNLTNGGAVICTTCHFAHGTFSRVEGIKQYDELDLNATTSLNAPGGYESAKNLRLDNRGVCQNCHNRDKGTAAPQLTDILNPTFDGRDIYGTTNSLLSGQQAGSFTDDSIMIRFNQYMWTNPTGPNVGSFPDDVENPARYSVSFNSLGGISPIRAKLQPDNRTVILYFNKDTITTGTTYKVTVLPGVQDLNWNKTTNSLVTPVYTK